LVSENKTLFNKKILVSENSFKWETSYPNEKLVYTYTIPSSQIKTSATNQGYVSIEYVTDEDNMFTIEIDIDIIPLHSTSDFAKFYENEYQANKNSFTASGSMTKGTIQVALFGFGKITYAEDNKTYLRVDFAMKNLAKSLNNDGTLRDSFTFNPYNMEWTTCESKWKKINCETISLRPAISDVAGEEIKPGREIKGMVLIDTKYGIGFENIEFGEYNSFKFEQQDEQGINHKFEH
jgi:hypothetical protein